MPSGSSFAFEERYPSLPRLLKKVHPYATNRRSCALTWIELSQAKSDLFDARLRKQDARSTSIRRQLNQRVARKRNGH
ncbi:MAG TPA: hypothetical protein VG498_19050, partial [Terriglobales bacterium]|nr:hypothetical protein [Terriglobales bacterium]